MVGAWRVGANEIWLKGNWGLQRCYRWPLWPQDDFRHHIKTHGSQETVKSFNMGKFTLSKMLMTL